MEGTLSTLEVQSQRVAVGPSFRRGDGFAQGRSPLVGRAGAGLGLVLCLTPLVIAAGLVPSPEGHGSHQQLGLPPCGMLLATGRPCPTCGMTTSFAWAAHGDLVRSFLVQPAGMLLCVVAAAGVWACLHTLVFKSRVLEVCLGLIRPRTIVVALVVLGAGWGYKLALWAS